jgi:DNA repair exonuclease SbcCD ATPase subunit
VKEFYPVLIPPVTYKSLPPFLTGTQSLLINEASHLDRMSDGLPKLFGKTFNVAKWNTKKDQFLKVVTKLLKGASKQARPTEQEIADLKKELQDYKALVDELTEEKEQLSAKLAAVSKLKDKKERIQVLQSFRVNRSGSNN